VDSEQMTEKVPNDLFANDDAKSAKSVSTFNERPLSPTNRSMQILVHTIFDNVMLIF
jgi:hypothetical protein